MTAIRLVIEVYGGIVQNVYVAHEAPESKVEAVVVDWDYESYDSLDDCLVHATGLDGDPTLACVWRAKLKPWRPLSAAGIQDVLDRAGFAAFGSQDSAVSADAPAGEALCPGRRRPDRAP